jgi:hypothetical protein
MTAQNKNKNNPFCLTVISFNLNSAKHYKKITCPLRKYILKVKTLSENGHNCRHEFETRTVGGQQR